jgi:hypothetical protein
MVSGRGFFSITWVLMISRPGALVGHGAAGMANIDFNIKVWGCAIGRRRITTIRRLTLTLPKPLSYGKFREQAGVLEAGDGCSPPAPGNDFVMKKHHCLSHPFPSVLIKTVTPCKHRDIWGWTWKTEGLSGTKKRNYPFCFLSAPPDQNLKQYK